jgi:hypothetical protein
MAACMTACAGSEDEEGGPDRCAQECRNTFLVTRFRQLSRVVQDCLLGRGGLDPHEVVAGTESWARAQLIPGTPTILVGHPKIGFKLLGDSDELTGALVEIGESLREARELMADS